jgi:predicted TPR repeat methyltransferase
MWSVSTMASARLPDDLVSEARALIEQDRAGEAAALLRPLVEAGGGGFLARSTLAQALSVGGDHVAALEIARETLQLHPGIPQAALDLGRILLRADALPVAIAELQRALRLDPDLADARYLLGCAWLEAGEPDKALEAFGSLAGPSTPKDLLAKIAEVQAMRAAPRADPRYVRHLFDQFSADYDARMIGQLHYAAPPILRELARLVLPEAANRSLAVLDLGCGTGLSGAAFHDLAFRLDGIDLSPAMVAEARSRGIYDALHVADIETALAARAATYDLLLAADTLVYLGDLARVFDGAQAALKPDGSFLFTTERAAAGDYELGPKRRWRHSEDYLRGQAGRAGFEVAGFLPCVPRTEAGQPVEGWAVALRKLS